MSYLMRIDPMHHMARMEREMDRWMRRFFRPLAELEEAEGVRIPSVDVSETENEVIVKAELPGIKKEDLNIEVLPDALRLSAQISREREEGGKEGTFHLRERVWGRFERLIPLPTEVKVDEAKASLHEGVLEIHLPKAEPTKAIEPKKIEVQ
jgi:HSP20 family protein